MSATVKISNLFQSVTDGVSEVEVSGGTLKECLLDTVRQFPKLQRLFFDSGEQIAGSLIIFVNGESAQNDGDSKVINDGDEIYPMLIIGGG
jgi:hypothetical protein